MKPTLYLILLITIFSCKHKHVSENKIQRTVENTETVLAPEIEKPLAKTEFRPRFENGIYIIDSIYSQQFGEIKLFNAAYDDILVENIFISFYQNKIKQTLNLTDVFILNTKGKLTLNSTFNNRLLVELESDYHTPLGSGGPIFVELSRKQYFVVDLNLGKKIFECTANEENFKTKGADSTLLSYETTEWITDSTAYLYDFKYQNDTIILKNYKGNTKPDMKMGMYIYDKGRYILRK